MPQEIGDRSEDDVASHMSDDITLAVEASRLRGGCMAPYLLYCEMCMPGYEAKDWTTSRDVAVT
jgi:hypothetical protein